MVLEIVLSRMKNYMIYYLLLTYEKLYNLVERNNILT